MKHKRSKVLQISSLKKGLIKIIAHCFAEDSKFILCFMCSLGTASGFALSVACFIFGNASLGLSCVGLILSIISFAILLYVVWKMD